MLLISQPFQPYLTYFALVFTCLLTFFKGFDAVMNPFDYKSFITHYIGIPIYIFGYIGYKCTSSLVTLLHGLTGSDPKDQDGQV
jgi:amino acid permease